MAWTIQSETVSPAAVVSNLVTQKIAVIVAGTLATSSRSRTGECRCIGPVSPLATQ